MSNQASTKPARLLRQLHIYGLDELDAMVLAALADARPLLLIGRHGTAKSALLNRLSEALGLEHRHYNASLISFDDLLGFPVPDAAGEQLQYLQTPASIWAAESVFFDEISRCRPETQNKLFSMIHERRVLGVKLEKLRYCWSAMNPPVQWGDEADHYAGSLPLEAPLADRFAWIVSIPDFTSFPEEECERMLLHGDAPIRTDHRLEPMIRQARAESAQLPAADRLWMQRWAQSLVGPLAEAGIYLSGRRLVLLLRNLESLTVASRVLGQEQPLESLALQTLRWSLPHPAQGQEIPAHGLLAAHQEAVQCAGNPQMDFWQKLRREKDPVCRLALALREPQITRLQRSQLFSDAWEKTSEEERFILVRNLLMAVSPEAFTTTVQEILAETLSGVLAFCVRKDRTFEYQWGNGRQWSRLRQTVTALEQNGHPEAEQLGNILLYLFLKKRQTRFNPEQLVMLDLNWRVLFRIDEQEREVAE